MNLRQTETRLATFTLAATGVFAPLETVASWQMGGGAGGLLGLPYFSGLMCAGHAWMAAMGWRATLWRLDARAEGQHLFYGTPELWATAAATALALASLACSLFLTHRADAGRDAASEQSVFAGSP